jgi:hypothetical protein
MRKFGARMICSKCRNLGHNKRACPMNRSEASNVRGSATSVDFLPHLQHSYIDQSQT